MNSHISVSTGGRRKHATGTNPVLYTNSKFWFSFTQFCIKCIQMDSSYRLKFV